MEPMGFVTPAEYWNEGQRFKVTIAIEARDGRIFVEQKPVRIELNGLQLRFFPEEKGTFYLVYDDQHPPKPIGVIYRELTQILSAQA